MSVCLCVCVSVRLCEVAKADMSVCLRVYMSACRLCLCVSVCVYMFACLFVLALAQAAKADV